MLEMCLGNYWFLRSQTAKSRQDWLAGGDDAMSYIMPFRLGPVGCLCEGREILQEVSIRRLKCREAFDLKRGAKQAVMLYTTREVA